MYAARVLPACSCCIEPRPRMRGTAAQAAPMKCVWLAIFNESASEGAPSTAPAHGQRTRQRSEVRGAGFSAWQHLPNEGSIQVPREGAGGRGPRAGRGRRARGSPALPARTTLTGFVALPQASWDSGSEAG